MSDEAGRELTPGERALDTPRITRALRQAVREALRVHKLMGNPVAVWNNDRVEWIQPEDILDFTDEEGEE